MGHGCDAPAPRIRATQLKLKHVGERLIREQRTQQQHRRQRLGQTAALLEAVSPLATVSRGYSIVARADGTVIREPADVSVGDSIRAQVAGGGLTCTVTDLDVDILQGTNLSADLSGS